MVNPNSDLKSRNSQWICHFQGRGVASQLARQLGPRGGALGGYPNSSYKNMPYRLDKSHSALAEAQLKIVQPVRLVLIRGSLR